MIQPYLINNNWVYVTVDGLVWLESGLKLPTNLEEKASDRLIDIYKTIEASKPLIVDFRNIDDVADRALEKLFKAFQTDTREIVLINYETISNSIDKNTNEHYKKTTESLCNPEGVCYKILNQAVITGDSIIQDVEIFRNEKIQEFVRSSFSMFETPRYLTSTPIFATGIFDASKLIKNQTMFYWICLQLSEKLKLLMNSGELTLNKGKEVKLLCVNLKSCPFASVVAQLNRIPLTTIDHLGPKHKVHDLDILDGLQNMKQYTYIYVGDFCVGGTEIKIAKTYASISNSELNTAIVIGSFFPEDHFKPSFSTKHLVRINGLHGSAKFTL